MDAEQRAQAVTTARGLIGTRWHHHGRTRAAVDCVGLLVVVAQELGIPHVDDLSYGMRPKPGALEGALERSGLVRIKVDEIQPGDVLAFWYGEKGLPYHVALVSSLDGRQTMIHAMAPFGSRPGIVQEVTLNQFWRHRVVSAWRYASSTDSHSERPSAPVASEVM